MSHGTHHAAVRSALQTITGDALRHDLEYMRRRTITAGWATSEPTKWQRDADALSPMRGLLFGVQSWDMPTLVAVMVRVMAQFVASSVATSERARWREDDTDGRSPVDVTVRTVPAD